MKTKSEIIAFLERVPLFDGLKTRQLEQFAERFVERTYSAGTEIVTQGHGGEGFFILVSGAAEIIRELSDGEKVVVNKIGPTDFFGELALLDDGVRTATVKATVDSVCLVLTRWDFLGVLKKDADMAIHILTVLAKRFRRALDAL